MRNESRCLGEGGGVKTSREGSWKSSSKRSCRAALRRGICNVQGGCTGAVSSIIISKKHNGRRVKEMASTREKRVLKETDNSPIERWN